MERRVISTWKKKHQGKAMQQVVYIDSKKGTSVTKHEPMKVSDGKK